MGVSETGIEELATTTRAIFGDAHPGGFSEADRTLFALALALRRRNETDGPRRALWNRHVMDLLVRLQAVTPRDWCREMLAAPSSAPVPKRKPRAWDVDWRNDRHERAWLLRAKRRRWAKKGLSYDGRFRTWS